MLFVNIQHEVLEFVRRGCSRAAVLHKLSLGHFFLITINQEFLMKPNVGGFDRLARLVIGLVLLFIWVIAPPANGLMQVGLLILTTIMLFTALIKYCPITSALGIDTSKPKEKQ
jgi:hypothetical protein